MGKTSTGQCFQWIVRNLIVWLSRLVNDLLDRLVVDVLVQGLAVLVERSGNDWSILKMDFVIDIGDALGDLGIEIVQGNPMLHLGTEVSRQIAQIGGLATALVEEVLATLDRELPGAGERDIPAFQRDRRLARLQHDLFLGLDLDPVIHRDHGDFLVRQNLQLIRMRLQ